MTIEQGTEKAIEEFEKVFGIICSTCNDEGYVLVAGHAQTPHENGECDGQCPIQEQEACSCNGYGYQLKDFIRKTRREACEEMREATKIEKPTEAYLPWLEKEMNIADHIHAEMHVMAARVNCAQDLDEVIQHGNDFRERMKEVVDAVLDQVDKNVEEKQTNYLKEKK